MFSHIKKVLRRDTSLNEIRHALITRIGKDEIFQTESSNRSVRRSSIPSEYLEIVSCLSLSPALTWGSALAIAFDLAQRCEPGNGLSCDSVKALKLIYSRNGGICSDVSQVFTGLCIAAGISVREWGVEEDFVAKKGHAFNEVFASEYGKWVFLDAFKSLYARVDDSTSPLSVAELVDRVTTGHGDKIEMVYFGPADKRAECMANISHYYLNPANVFFLLSNNNVFGQDLLLRWAHVVPLAVLHALMLAVGIYPRFAIYTNDVTRQKLIERLQAHKHKRNLASMLLRLVKAVVQA